MGITIILLKITIILLKNAFHYVPKKKERKKMTTKKLYTSETHYELVEKYRISRFLKVDVVLEDLIAIGPDLLDSTNPVDSRDG